MVSSVNSISSAQAVAPPAVASQPAAQSSSPTKASTSVTDTVRLSSAAQLAQEATETPAQTAKEANSGDLQARRLLAHEAAEHAVGK